MLGKIVMTFVPCLIYLAVALTVVVSFRLTRPVYVGRHRKPRRPARTPLPIVSAGPVRAQAS